MNGISLNMTHFASAFCETPCLIPCHPPSTASCVSPATGPSGMIFLTDITGLPLSHTSVITKGFFSMEITGWASNVLSAIVTLFCKFILWPAMLIASLMIASQRTIDFIETQKGRESLFASRANLFNCMIFVLKSWHDYLVSFSISNVKKNNIGIEIEEKYCAIAVERLKQGVLAL